MKEEQVTEERQESKSQKQPQHGGAEVESSKTCSVDSNLARGTVTARGDQEIREETKKPKLKCLNLCNVDVENMESLLVENDRTLW